MGKIALITGATSGIGRATALELAKEGYDIIITGRRSELLAKLKDEIESKSYTKVLTLAFDIQVYSEVESALEINIPRSWSKIDVLVNNAGLGTFSPIYEGNPEDWDKMIDTNIKGLLYVTRIVTANMVRRKSGHVVNIGSTASRVPTQNGAVYSATKSAIDALSQAMRLDLRPYGIQVSQVRPARVRSEFAVVSNRGDAKIAKKHYEEFSPLEVEDIANAISYVLSQPPRANVHEILVMPMAEKK